MKSDRWLLVLAIAIALVLHHLAHAASDLPTVPVSDPTYGTAAQKAQQAFFAQSGLNNDYHLIQDYGTGTGMSFLQKAGLDKEAGAIVFGYKVYHDRAVSFPITHDTRMTLHPDQLSLSISF